MPQKMLDQAKEIVPGQSIIQLSVIAPSHRCSPLSLALTTRTLAQILIDEKVS